MSYKVCFLDNELVTEDYLNGILQELGGGVTSFANDMVYGVDELNKISGDLITKGVSHGCNLSVNEEMVFIAEGLLFMGDGKKVEIDAAGITLPFIFGKQNYVWFYHDTVTGFVVPRCTVEEPSGEDYILLGTVTTEGKIAGKPHRAMMKNALLNLNGFEQFSREFLWDGTTEKKLLWEFELLKPGYRHVVVSSNGYLNGEDCYNAVCGFVNLEDQKAFSVLCTTVYGNDDNTGVVKENANGDILISRCLKSVVGNDYYDIYLHFEIGNDAVLRAYQYGVKSGLRGYNGTPKTQLNITVC